MKCALCLTGEPIEDGHVMPHFVFRHIVKTSPTGFLRYSENPNIRRQDGKRLRFLCPACEDRFAIWERVFAQQVFHPLHKHQITRNNTCPPMGQFTYGDWLLKFCASVSWRSLYDLVLDRRNDQLPHGDNDIAEKALTTWRAFLIGETTSLEGFDQHLVIVGAPSETRGIDNSLDLKMYFERALTHCTWHNKTEAYVFTKMCRVIIVGTIKDSEHVWRGTRISKSSGQYSSREQVLSGVFNSWIRDDLSGMPVARQRLSDNQNSVIEESVKRYFSNNGTGPIR